MSGGISGDVQWVGLRSGSRKDTVSLGRASFSRYDNGRRERLDL